MISLFLVFSWFRKCSTVTFCEKLELKLAVDTRQLFAPLRCSDCILFHESIIKRNLNINDLNLLRVAPLNLIVIYLDRETVEAYEIGANFETLVNVRRT